MTTPLAQLMFESNQEYFGRLESIAAIIADYREGEIERTTPAHVEKWIGQFDDAARNPLLKAMEGALKQTYLSRVKFENFCAELLERVLPSGSDASKFWLSMNILRVQWSGESQRAMLKLLDAQIHAKFGFRLDDCGAPSGDFLFLDDIVFTGNRVWRDLEKWIRKEAPPRARIVIAAMIQHRAGTDRIRAEVARIAELCGKRIELDFIANDWVEDRGGEYGEMDASDLLRPTELPNDPAVAEYVEKLKTSGFKPCLRVAARTAQGKLFASEEERSLLEKEFLKVGAKIRQAGPDLPESIRPLGYVKLKVVKKGSEMESAGILDRLGARFGWKTLEPPVRENSSSLRALGFGSLYVTYRNCPVNCPPALWRKGEGWYPLFPRDRKPEAEEE